MSSVIVFWSVCDLAGSCYLASFVDEDAAKDFARGENAKRDVPRFQVERELRIEAAS